MQVSTQVKMTVNTENLLTNTLRKAFAGKTSVVQELAQNARRAGAKKIEFWLDASNKQLTVIDDGSGITDFNQLLTVADSAWHQTTMDIESPFGVGFLSALYSAENISICSKGQKIIAKTDDILCQRQIPIRSCEDDGHTTIALWGENVSKLVDMLTEHEFDNMKTMFKGFSVPVTVNGIDLKREDAVSSPDKTFIHQEEASTCINMRVSETNGLHVSSSWVAYYQGFKIASWEDIQHRWSKSNDDNVVHLSSEHFDAVAPDRTRLVDHKANAKRIDEMVKKAIADAIDRFAQTDSSMDVEVVLLNSLNQLQKHRKVDLLNKIDRLPVEVLRRYDVDGEFDLPILHVNHGHNLVGISNPTSFISRKSVENGDITVFSEEPKEDVDEDFLYETFLWESQQAFYLNGCLNEDHWIYGSLTSPYDEDGESKFSIEVEGGRDPLTAQKDSYCEIPIKFCDSYSITSPCGKTLRTNDIPCMHVGSGEGFEGVNVFIPKNGATTDCLMQTNSYFFDDALQTESMDSDRSRFNQWLMMERMANDPEALLNKLLENHKAYPMLDNKTFQVAFDDDKISVSILDSENK